MKILQTIAKMEEIVDLVKSSNVLLPTYTFGKVIEPDYWFEVLKHGEHEFYIKPSAEQLENLKPNEITMKIISVINKYYDRQIKEK